MEKQWTEFLLQAFLWMSLSMIKHLTKSCSGLSKTVSTTGDWVPKDYCSLPLLFVDYWQLFIYLFLAEITFCIEVSFHCSNIYRTKVHITLCMLFYMNLSTAEFPKDTDWNLIKIWLKSTRCYNQNASVWTSSERIELELVMYRRTDIMSTKTRTVQTKPILGFTLIAKTTVLIT